MTTTPQQIPDPLALRNRRPELSAWEPLTRSQKRFCMFGCAAIVVAAILAPWTTARVFVALSTAFYLLFTVYKLVLARRSLSHSAEIKITAQELRAMDNSSLPVYSVLVPMYHEPETVAHLVKALDAMDYPADKKDIQLLLEEDDPATIAAVDAITLPHGFRVTSIPVSFPRTKPKACNIGLEYARGEFLVIYDAEDRPEPDQLKKAVAAFRRAEPEVVCLQSRLNFYNPRHNLLTRWFASEYSVWFDLGLPGLASMNAVIPLGGTSNHFKTAALRELLGWDAYNVTEDCDLGVRIYRAGYRSRMLNTTTWEEACGNLHFWIRQRTRWLKGYIQTWLVHMRNPRSLRRDLGLINLLHFHLLIGGIVFSFLINPLYWALALAWFIWRVEAFTHLFPGPVFAAGAMCLFVGNFAFVYMGALGCLKRGYDDLVKYTLLSPLYWMMMSYSGWRAFFQFFSAPFHWEKTRHTGSGGGN